MTILKNRIALITGASRGIGQAAAKRLAKEGAHVILLARNKKGLEETDDAIRSLIPPPSGGGATLVPIDITDTKALEELSVVIRERFGKLDIMVGNAAILGDLTPMVHVDISMWEKVFAANVTANVNLIRCFDDLLKKSDAPRAMFVTSGITQGVFPYWGPYATSKKALECLVETYAAENEKTLVRANLIDPGIVQTRMRAEAMPGEDPEQWPLPDAITDVFVKLADPNLKETGKRFFAQA